MIGAARKSWLLVAMLAAGCAQIIHADFDDLKPMPPASGAGGAGGAGGMGAGTAGQGGAAGDGGMGGGSGGAAGEGGEGGAQGGSAGAGGSVFEGGTTDASDAGLDVARDAPPDRADDAPHDAGRDVATEVAVDAPEERHPDEASVEAGEAAAGSIVINELEGIGEDWIELYNPGGAPFALDGYAISQAMGSNGPPDISTTLFFPAGTTLNPGAYLMVLCKQGSIGGPTTACAGLAGSCYTVTWGISSSAGEGMYILRPDRSILAEVDYPAPGDGGVPVSGQTWGRIPNGSGGFTATFPTPNGPNHL